MMAKKTATKKVTKKKSSPKKAKRKSAKRELISPNSDARYMRRNVEGEFDESDDAGRLQKVDRPKAAKRAVPSGQGDKGDRKKASL